MHSADLCPHDPLPGRRPRTCFQGGIVHLPRDATDEHLVLRVAHGAGLQTELTGWLLPADATFMAAILLYSLSPAALLAAGWVAASAAVTQAAELMLAPQSLELAVAAAYFRLSKLCSGVGSLNMNARVTERQARIKTPRRLQALVDVNKQQFHQCAKGFW